MHKFNLSQRVLHWLTCHVSESSNLFIWKQWHFLMIASRAHGKVWNFHCFALQQIPDKSFSLFQLLCQKLKILNRIKFDQEILTKLLKRMHQLSINPLCSSDYQTTYSFCEIKHFFKQAKNLWIHFPGLLLKNITCFITSFLVLKVL